LTGCAGLAAAIQTVHPRAKHQRCCVHKIRDILHKVKKTDYQDVKRSAQEVDRIKTARLLVKEFRMRWVKQYPLIVKQLEKDLPELLSFISLPKNQWSN
jgi:putative transposase